MDPVICAYIGVSFSPRVRNTSIKIVLCFQVVEDGYEFFAKRQLVTLFSAPNYCGEFDNAGAMMSVDETLMCSFQVRSYLNLCHGVTPINYSVRCDNTSVRWR